MFVGILCKGPGSTAAPAAVDTVLSKPELIPKTISETSSRWQNCFPS